MDARGAGTHCQNRRLQAADFTRHRETVFFGGSAEKSRTDCFSGFPGKRRIKRRFPSDFSGNSPIQQRCDRVWDETDLEGRRLGFLRATGRHVASFLSYYGALLGFLMLFFNERRQTLHDRISGTVILRRRQGQDTEAGPGQA